MPLASQAAISSSEIGRDASEMSVSPLQNSSKPSPVPGPSTATVTPELAIENCSATSDVMGSTVEEPETLMEPESSSSELPLPLEFVSESSSPQAASTSAAAAATASGARR